MLLIEMLSPSNEAATRANMWTYCLIPSVSEVLLLSSAPVTAELLRRDGAGKWPRVPTMLRNDDILRLDSIGCADRLRAFYATTSLTE